MKRSLVAVMVTIGLGLFGLYLVTGPKIFQRSTFATNYFGYDMVLLCAAIFLVMWLTPSMRFRLLTMQQGFDLPLRQALAIHLLSVLGAALTPSGSGGGPAIAAGLRKLGIPWGRGIGLAIQIFVLDLSFFAWAVPLSLAYLISFGLIQLPLNLTVLAIISAIIAIVGAIILSRYPRPIVRFILWLSNRRALKRFKERLVRIARDYYRSTRLFMGMRWRSWLALQTISALSWLSTFTLLWALLRFYEPADLPTITAMLSIISLVSFVMPTPGASGFMEVAIGYSTSGQVSAVNLAAPLLLYRLLGFYVVYLIGPLAGWLLFTSKPSLLKRISLRPRRKRGR